VDWASQSTALINKVRPLVAHQGVLALSITRCISARRDFYAHLEAICASGYLQIETLLPIPEDVTGTASTRQTRRPATQRRLTTPQKLSCCAYGAKTKPRPVVPECPFRR
jgi:23S rRNA (cytosine1962-C5)-methyltransferase